MPARFFGLRRLHLSRAVAGVQICAVYGKYYQRLSKEMQTALADANVVAEEALSTVVTVRAHAAEAGCSVSYAKALMKYYLITVKAAIAYGIYVSINTFLPQARPAAAARSLACLDAVGTFLACVMRWRGGLVPASLIVQQKLSGTPTTALQSQGHFTSHIHSPGSAHLVEHSTAVEQAVAAVVLLHGGYLVYHAVMTRGQLVSFMLYQASLAGTLDTLGSVFTALMAAVGAADAVVALLRREPKGPAKGVAKADEVRGHLELQGVHFAYPSRPQVCARRCWLFRLL